MSIKMTIPRVVVWFSCGAASAVAAKLAVEKYGHSEMDVVYCDTMSAEHPDNRRFFDDVQTWLGHPIRVIKSGKFESVDAVFAKGATYMSGIKGAPCTVQMKKVPRFNFQRPDDIHIFGMTADEKKRAGLFAKNNHELSLEWNLIDAGISKLDCLARITAAGIELPAMYRLGFKNNNCLGCVKATSPSYWNSIRANFPDVFAKRVEQSRRIGCRLVRVNNVRVFLDELAPDNTEVIEEDLSCGPQCTGEIQP